MKLRVKAPPIDGRANDALIAFLAKQVGVPKSRLALVAGDTARLKCIEIDADISDLEDRLGA